MNYLLLFGVIFALAYRDVWVDVQVRKHERDKLFVLGLTFLLALCLGLLILAIEHFGFRRLRSLRASEWTNIGLLALTTAVAWPAAFLALLTTLRSSRADFLDWGLVPVFGLIVTVALTTDILLWTDIVGALIAVGGCALIVRSLSQSEERVARWWPEGSTYRISMVTGIILASISAVAGVLTFHYARELRAAEVPTSLSMAIRIAPLGPFLLLASFTMKGKKSRALDRTVVILCFKFVGLIYVPLFLLFEMAANPVLKVKHATMWLVLIPVLVFALNVWPFRERHWEHIPKLEVLGMVLVVIGAILALV